MNELECDVALLEQALKSVGFDVAVERDAGLGALTRAVNAYASDLPAGKVVPSAAPSTRLNHR